MLAHPLPDLRIWWTIIIEWIYTSCNVAVNIYIHESSPLSLWDFYGFVTPFSYVRMQTLDFGNKPLLSYLYLDLLLFPSSTNHIHVCEMKKYDIRATTLLNMDNTEGWGIQNYGVVQISWHYSAHVDSRMKPPDTRIPVFQIESEVTSQLIGWVVLCCNWICNQNANEL
jgi:hypothetical protein